MIVGVLWNKRAGGLGAAWKRETVKGLAFDAVTAWRVFSLDRYVWDEPETPAAEAPTICGFDSTRASIL